MIPTAIHPLTSNTCPGTAAPVYIVDDFVGAFVAPVDMLSHPQSVTVAVQVPLVRLEGQAVALHIGDEDIALEFELEHTPKADWQPAIQYSGPAPLFQSRKYLTAMDTYATRKHNLPVTLAAAAFSAAVAHAGVSHGSSATAVRRHGTCRARSRRSSAG